MLDIELHFIRDVRFQILLIVGGVRVWIRIKSEHRTEIRVEVRFEVC